MRHKQQSLGKVICTAAVAGGFGGALWFLMLLIFVPAQERYSREWWLVGLGATLFWSAVGVIVAAFGAGGPFTDRRLLQANPPRGRSWALVLFLATGSFLYRLLVGYLMASIVVGVFVLPFIGLGFAFESSLDKFRGTALALAVSGAYLGGMAGGTAGGLVGALFAVRSPPGTKYGVARWAILGSVLGLPFGAAFGAAAGLIAAIIVGMEAVEKDPNLVFLPLASGFVGGVFAGVLAAFVSKLSSTQKRKNGRMG